MLRKVIVKNQKMYVIIINATIIIILMNLKKIIRWKKIFDLWIEEFHLTVYYSIKFKQITTLLYNDK